MKSATVPVLYCEEDKGLLWYIGVVSWPTMYINSTNTNFSGCVPLPKARFETTVKDEFTHERTEVIDIELDNMDFYEVKRYPCILTNVSSFVERVKRFKEFTPSGAGPLVIRTGFKMPQDDPTKHIDEDEEE